jgi:hypothetical protein
MLRLLSMAVMCTLLLPFAGITAETKTAFPEKETQTMDGIFWIVMEKRSAPGSLLMYSSGFVSGYDYAINLLQGVIETQNYDKLDLLEFMDMLKYPTKYKNSEIKKLIDEFYSDEANRHLPLFVAFTFARQVLSGYPKEYSLSYIEDMRDAYIPEIE